jgi:thiol-disulfide isomerase/thioredoxin
MRRRALLATLPALGGIRLAAAAPAPLGAPVDWPAVRLLDGRRLDAEALRGRAWLVVFFSTDCPYCRRHNQRLDRLARAVGEGPLRVVGVASDRDPDRVQAYLREQGLAFDVTLDVAPLRAALSERRIVPLTAVIDRQGRLRELIPGEMADDDLLGLVRWMHTD